MRSPMVVFVICVAACAIAHVAILVSSVSARATSSASAATSAVPRPRVVLEFVWALVPILALALVFTATWARVTDRERHPPETMKVAQ